MNKTVFDIVKEVVKQGPSIPQNHPLLQITKEYHPEDYHFILDKPTGSGLYHSFLYEYIKQMKPKNVVELGHRHGLSTLAMLIAAEEANVDCSITTIDNVSNLSFLSDETKSHPKLRVCVTDSCDSSVVNSFVDNSVDFIFIDTEHTYQKISSEWKTWKPKLKSGAVVVCDDINWPGMNSFINDINHFQWMNEPALHGSGFLVFVYKAPQVYRNSFGRKSSENLRMSFMKKVAQDYEKGTRIKKLMKKYNICNKSVYNCLTKTGTKPNRQKNS